MNKLEFVQNAKGLLSMLGITASIFFVSNIINHKKLSALERKHSQIPSVFQEYDINRDGNLDNGEIKNMLNDPKFYNSMQTKIDESSIFREMSTNANFNIWYQSHFNTCFKGTKIYFINPTNIYNCYKKSLSKNK